MRSYKMRKWLIHLTTLGLLGVEGGVRDVVFLASPGSEFILSLKIFGLVIILPYSCTISFHVKLSTEIQISLLSLTL